MKARIKFRKYGNLRFIGHLDVMRHFQKLMRRAGIPIAFTGGYSPHMVMSFASPLGIGLTSDGEYADIELTEPIESGEAVRRMNAVAAEGIEIMSFREISAEKKMTAMAIVAAADYLVRDKNDMELEMSVSDKCQSEFGGVQKSPFFDGWEHCLAEFSAQSEIRVLKQTKRSEEVVDIRPMIYCLEARGDTIYMQLAAGSVKNLKPDLVMDAFIAFAEEKTSWKIKLPLAYHRLELYADMGNEGNRSLVTLESLGKEIL